MRKVGRVWLAARPSSSPRPLRAIRNESDCQARPALLQACRSAQRRLPDQAIPCQPPPTDRSLIRRAMSHLAARADPAIAPAPSRQNRIFHSVHPRRPPLALGPGQPFSFPAHMPPTPPWPASPQGWVLDRDAADPHIPTVVTNAILAICMASPALVFSSPRPLAIIPSLLCPDSPCARPRPSIEELRLSPPPIASFHIEHGRPLWPGRQTASPPAARKFEFSSLFYFFFYVLFGE